MFKNKLFWHPSNQNPHFIYTLYSVASRIIEKNHSLHTNWVFVEEIKLKFLEFMDLSLGCYKQLQKVSSSKCF